MGVDAAGAMLGLPKLVPVSLQLSAIRPHFNALFDALTEENLENAAIAERVGFASESNFSYRFTQMVGQGPRAYRQAAPELVLEG